MLFGFVVVLSLAGGALAGPYKRFDGLTVELQASAANVSSVDDLVLTATVTNGGAESVKLLRYGTILDSQLPTKSFKVTKDGQDVAFTGIKLSVSLSEVDDTAFTVIPAGESVTAIHQVASLFDFAAAGAGNYTFEPVTTFQVQDASPAATQRLAAAFELSKVEATTNSVEVELSGDLANRELPELDKRAVDICTTPYKKAMIDDSYTEAKTLAVAAFFHIYVRGASDPLYRAYWGATPTSRVNSVYSAIIDEKSSTRTLSCVDSYRGCASGVIAYTLVSTSNIYFCNPFFTEVAVSRLCSDTSVASRNIRGGTTLHELTHALSGTTDVTYGCVADQYLNDAQSVINADNYNCFATQVYASGHCHH